MSSDDNDKDVGPVRLEAGVVAKAEAKYTRTTEISVSVPEDVTRAKAEAFLDAISPLTQGLGLIGDWIGDKRERLKLHRLQSLEKIANKARAQVEQQQVEPKPIPVKALIPILDRASLEEADDETLTDAWAALIASASLEYDPEVIAFSRVLSELSPRECLILQRVFGERWGWVRGKRPPAAMRAFFEREAEIKSMLRSAVVGGDVSVFEKLQRFVDPAMPMEFTVALTRGTSQHANWTDKLLKLPFYDQNELGYQLLEAQGLIQVRGQSYPWMTGETPVAVDWVELTDLGSRFVARVVARPEKVST